MALKVKSPDGTVLYLSGAPKYQLASDYIGDPPADRTYIFVNRCTIPQDTVRCREMHLHAASLAVLTDGAAINASGIDGVQNVTSTDDHANATSAYPIFLSTAKFELPNPLQIIARGGNGAVGYSPPDASQPGVGGNAGDGANATFLVNTEFDNVADNAEKIISDTTQTPELKIADMTEWAQLAQLVSEPNAPDSISWVYNTTIDQSQADMDPTGPLPHAINAKTFLGLMAVTVKTLRESSSDFLSKVDCRPGKPGHGGNASTTSRKGPDGTDGKPGHSSVTTWTEAGVLNSAELVFHPDQIGLTLRDIENSYFIGSSDSIMEARTKLDTLITQLSPLKNVRPTDNIYKAYAAKEYSTLAVLPSSIPGTSASLNSLQNSLKLATQYRVQINQGYDFYRHNSTWVPRGSYEFYETAFQTVLEDFESVEANYFNYQKVANDDSNRLNQVQKAKEAARRGESLATADIHTLGQELSETASHIAALQEDVPRKHRAVDDKLRALADKIQTSVKWPTMKEFLSAAGQMAFCPEPEMVAVQGASLMTTSLTEVHNEAGEAVNKDYVVGKIHLLTTGLDGLKEAVDISARDPLLNVDDPGAAKLLAQESDVMDLVNQYRGVLGGDLDEFKSLFDDYINTVIQRNNEVIHYNSLITLFCQARAKVNLFRADQDTLGSEEADLINSEIPALANTIKASYFDYTAKVLELLYDTQRALTFWSLDPGSVDLSLLRDQDFPSEGLGARLKTAKGDIIKDFADATNSLSVGRQPYGVTQGASGQPKTVELNQYQLEQLKMTPLSSTGEYFTTVTVPVATKTDSVEMNVFASNADVRVSTVRAYLEGARTQDDVLNITLQHLGDEKFVTVHNAVKHFTHDRLVFVFEYSLAAGSIRRDGNIGADDTYGLPGPFATWKLGLSPTANKKLDLSGVTRAWFEFSGYSRSFK